MDDSQSWKKMFYPQYVIEERVKSKLPGISHGDTSWSLVFQSYVASGITV